MKNFITKLIIAAMMIATSALFGIKISEIKTLPAPTNPQSSKESQTKFVLKYSDGTVTLFDGDNIIETFSEVNFSTLPPSDREILCEGIEFDRIDEVYQLIEDFDG